MSNKKFIIYYVVLFLVLGFAALKIMFPDLLSNDGNASSNYQYQTEKREVHPSQYSIFAYENFPVIYETGLQLDIQYDISDEDYKLYNEIMDYLYEHYDISEDVLFEELSLVYGKPADELIQFTQENMYEATNRRLNKIASGTKISDQQIIECSKQIFESALKTTVYCSDDPNDWEISESGIGHVIITMIGTHPDYLIREVIINVVFDDYYTSFELTKLKLNDEYYYPRN